VLTGAGQTAHDLLIVATVDMPGVRRPQFDWLIATLADRPDLMGILPVRRDGESEQVEPFPCVLRRESHDDIAAQLANRRDGPCIRSCRSAASGRRPCRAKWDPAVWTNLNHPADLKRFEST